MLVQGPSVILGDFNTGPDYSKARCGDRFASMAAGGFMHALPSGEGSYWTPVGKQKQLDHAFVSPHLRLVSANYLREKDGTLLAGKGGMSDHALLLVELERIPTVLR